MRTYAGHSTPAKSNELYRTNLAKGQTGLSVAFDLPTQTGYDPDSELARGEVGKLGGERSHPLFTSPREREAPHPCRADMNRTTVLGVGFAHRETVALQRVDHTRHGGGAYALRGCQLADGDGSGEHDDRECGEPGRG